MVFLSQLSGYILLIGFGVAMFLITYFFAHKNWKTKEGFLLANRKVGWILGGASIAASWIWAPALFISVQMAYQKGLAGIFWFTFPNIVALALFAFLAPKIRDLFPEGYTLPQYISQRLKSENVHKIYLFPYFFYQLMAVTVQVFVGGNLITLLTGIPLVIVMPALTIITLAYTLLSGMKASIVTDFVQIVTIYIIGLIIIPLLWTNVGGLHTLALGLHGIENVTNIFDPWVAFSFGIVSAIGLIAGCISDQQYWQRAFTIKREDLTKAFLFGAFLFGLVPIAMSLLGFFAAGLNTVVPVGTDVSMVGVQLVANVLPSWAIMLFVLMLLAGLTSTLDSGLMATSSLWVIDVLKSEGNVVKQGRLAMILISILGLAVAFAVTYIPGIGLTQLWWIFNTIAACVVVPTVLSLYWNKLSAKGVFWGVLVAFFAGIPFFVYGNIINNPFWVVGSSVFIIAISTLFCLIFAKSQGDKVCVTE